MKTTFCLIQDKYECICLGLGQAKNQSPSTVYTLYNVQCTMHTLYKVQAVHTVQTNWSKPVQLYCVHTQYS